MNSPDGNHLWCPGKSLWRLIAEHVSGSELQEIHTALGHSLVDMYTEVHNEAEMWHKMWQKSQQGGNHGRGAGTRLTPPQGSPLADPPAVKELLRAEVKMLLQTLRERASRGGRDGEELLSRYKPETINYARSHLDSCYRKCTNPKNTENGSRPSSHCSVQSSAEDEIEAMRDKLNVTEITQVVDRLRSLLMEECKALTRLLKHLKGNIKQKLQSQCEFDKPEPSLAELRELRGALQMDLELFPSSLAASPPLPVREMKSSYRLSAGRGPETPLALTPTQVLRPHPPPPLCHSQPRPPAGPPLTKTSISRTHDGEKIPNCTAEPLQENSLQRATDIEKILLSLPRFIRTYPLWIDQGKTSGQNFQINIKRTFGSMVEGLKSFPLLNAALPLHLKISDMMGVLLFSSVKMDAIFNLLNRYRLESYYHQFVQLGVKDERDFLDGVTDEDLSNMGLSHVEKNRFSAMKTFIERLGGPKLQTVTPLQKSVQLFSLLYTYPKCPEPKHINDMDSAQNTVEDLMLRICHFENVGNAKGVCLYTADGMPLTDDPFFNTWSLSERHIGNGAVIYAIFTPKKNLKEAPQMPDREPETFGEDVIRCHIMLKGDFEVMVDLETDTMASLRRKLSNASGIPAHVLHHTGEHSGGDTLQKCGISEGSTVAFALSSFPEETPHDETFYIDDVVPSVPQTKKGMSVFFSSLYAISRYPESIQDKLIAYIRKLTGCNPLAQSLHQLFCRNVKMTRNQKIAVVEGLYVLFRELLPQQGSQRGEKVIQDQDVFENSLFCWGHLMHKLKKWTTELEVYAPITLRSEDGNHFCEPVRVPGVPGVFERAHVLQIIKDGEKIPNCTAEPLQENSLQRATDIEKILLSLPRFIRTYPLWIDQGKTSGQNFQINIQRTFGSMVEGLKSFPLLNVAPPLHLKNLGYAGSSLVFLSEDNLGIYLYKDKGATDMVVVRDCLDGKQKTVDVNVLAAMTGNLTDDQSFVTTRTPKEAIMVLIDTSSSMEEECYDNAEIKKINTVKELFDNFATRSMAYDFHHVIGLVKFDSMVKTLHTFTENLENFKVHIRSLEASGCTLLYDALRRGVSELEKVKTKFPDCRLRIICLTDGNDSGSSIEPAAVTVKLLKSNIIVDSILLGKVENNMLHGISNATGGCCFKPQTTKDGLKLFEIETVLSLEQRKPKHKLDPSSISESTLTGMFASRGYDEYPETSLPSQINSKVTMTESALKKKIRDAKGRCFMEKDKRILEELKSLHCDPHPFCRVFPAESDLTFWKILMQGPPETPYEKGVFELYCQFGHDYPVKPPVVRFVTPVYHCNVNSVGRICHNIFDRNYNAHITMREVLDAVYGLLIIPEPGDPLDSILAEEFLTSRETYEQEARKHTEKNAGKYLDDMETKLVEAVPQFIPQHLLCPLTKKIFVDPVKTVYGTVYERKSIEKHLKRHQYDPMAGPGHELQMSDLTADRDMKKIVMDYRSRQIQ